MATNPPGDTPPTGGAPQPAGAGGFDLGQAFSWSWNQFGKNAQVLLTIGAIVFGIQFVFRILQIPLSGGFAFAPGFNSTRSSIVEIFLIFVLGMVLPIAGLLLSSLVTLGLIRVSLELTRGNKITLGEAFQTKAWGSYIVASILYFLSLMFGIVVCCIGILVPIIMFAFYGYFVVDRNAGPTKALSESWKLVASRFGEVILLLLCYLGITVLGYLSWGLASIFTVPFAALFLAYAYRTLRGESVASA